MPGCRTSSTVVVGIAGGSASGKTTIAKQIAREAGTEKATVLAMDRFYLSKADRQKIDHDNYDHPAAIDFALLESVVSALLDGKSASIPIYDFASHDRIGFETMVAARLLVIEGILVLWNATIRKLIDCAVYVDAPDNVRLRRRLERDTRERGRDPRSIESQWATSVLPMHAQHVVPTKSFADHVVDGESSYDKTARFLLRQLEIAKH